MLMHDVGLVIAIIAVISVLLGFGLGCAVTKGLIKKRPADGAIEVSATDTSQIYQFELNIEPEELKEKDAVVFKVRKI